MTFPNLVRLNRQRWVALTLGVVLLTSYGYPLTMTLDAIPDAIDDEMSVRITSLDPTGESPEGDGY